MRKVRCSAIVCSVLVALTGACNRQAQEARPPSNAQATAEPTPGLTQGTLVFIGDSLTAGQGLSKEQAFPALIEARLRAAGRPWKVVNAGVSGDTTACGASLWRRRNGICVPFWTARNAKEPGWCLLASNFRKTTARPTGPPSPR